MNKNLASVPKSPNQMGSLSVKKCKLKIITLWAPLAEEESAA
jgi:hypothetical protein